jgi:hypothetical protein
VWWATDHALAAAGFSALSPARKRIDFGGILGRILIQV